MTRSPSPPRTFSAKDLVALLSTTLGEPRAGEVVAGAMKALGLHADSPMEVGAAKRVLTFVSNVDGLVGITGRVALTRIQFGSAASGTLPAAALAPDTRPRSLVVRLLAPNLGEERAQKLVEETAQVMDLPAELELEQALALLEKITRMSGVIGVAARFAKTRIHLSW